MSQVQPEFTADEGIPPMESAPTPPADDLMKVKYIPRPVGYAGVTHSVFESDEIF